MLLLVIVWGVNFPVIKVAFDDLPPFAFNGLRFAVAAVLLLLILARIEGPLRIDRRDVLGLALLGLLGHAGYQTLFIAGLARTTAGHSSIILSMMPLFVGALGAALRIERPSSRMWIGLAMAFAGVVILVYGRIGLASHGASLAGDLLTLAGALCWALYTVLSRPWLARFSAQRLTAITLGFGLPVILASAAPGLLRLDWASVGPRAWAALGFSSVFAVVISYVIWYSSVQAVGSARTAAFSNLIPIVALMASWVVLHEPLGMPQIVGTAVILTGVWLARTGQPAVSIGSPARA
ncbi:MAG: DMT family transporter [Armatimonadota bacterium]|nr:DMT family transporter [Armatimonadota bacterium]